MHNNTVTLEFFNYNKVCDISPYNTFLDLKKKIQGTNNLPSLLNIKLIFSGIEILNDADITEYRGQKITAVIVPIRCIYH